MTYSIKPILHHVADKNGEHKIQMLIIYKRMKFTLPTSFHVKANQFLNGRCTGFKLANIYNQKLVAQKENYERLLINAIDDNPDKKTLKELFACKEETPVFKTFCEYATDLTARLTGKLSPGRISHYNKLIQCVKNIGDIELKKVSKVTANELEKYLRECGLSNNTINSKMKMFIAIINHAKNEKLVAADCLLAYKKPAYIQPIPDYLTQQELAAFKNLVDATIVTGYKTAGYYYLLSCYTGYRISDLTRFNYKDSIHGETIVIRAKKNKEIVVIPIYTKLAEVLEKIKDLPFYFTEQTMRKYVKELALLAGLGRKIKVHTARHTFAMMLIEKGFSEKEAAELLGDSVDVARIYARISNKQLQQHVKDRLG